MTRAVGSWSPFQGFFHLLKGRKRSPRKNRGKTTKSVKSFLGSSTHLLDVGHLLNVLFASSKAEKGHQKNNTEQTTESVISTLGGSTHLLDVGLLFNLPQNNVVAEKRVFIKDFVFSKRMFFPFPDEVLISKENLVPISISLKK